MRTARGRAAHPARQFAVWLRPATEQLARKWPFSTADASWFGDSHSVFFAIVLVSFSRALLSLDLATLLR